MVGKNNEMGSLDKKTVKNFRMYKSGKRWVFAGLAFLGVGATATLVNGQTAHADTVGDNSSNQTTVTSSNVNQTSQATPSQVVVAQSFDTSAVFSATSSNLDVNQANVTSAIDLQSVTSSDTQSSVISGSSSSQSVNVSGSSNSSSSSVEMSTASVNSTAESTPSLVFINTASQFSDDDAIELRDGATSSYTTSQTNVINSLNSSYGTSFMFSAYWNGDSSAGAAIYTDNASDAYLDNGWVGYYTSAYSSAMNLGSYTNIKFSNVTYNPGNSFNNINAVVSSVANYCGDVDSYFNNNSLIQHLDFGSSFNYGGPITNNKSLETLSLGSAFGATSAYNVVSLSLAYQQTDLGFFNNPSLKVLDLRNTQLSYASELSNYNSILANLTNSTASMTDLYLGSAFNSITPVCASSLLFGLSDGVKVHVDSNTAVPDFLMSIDNNGNSQDSFNTLTFNGIIQNDGTVVATASLSQANYGYLFPSSGYLINISQYLKSTADSLSAFVNDNQSNINKASNAVTSASSAVINVSNGINQNVNSLNSAINQISVFANQYQSDTVISSLNNNFSSVSSDMSYAQVIAGSANSVINSYTPIINSVSSAFVFNLSTASSTVSVYYSNVSSVNDSVIASNIASQWQFLTNQGYINAGNSSAMQSAVSAKNWNYFLTASNFQIRSLASLNVMESPAYTQSDLSSVASYSAIASSAVAVAASDVAAMWSVYSAIQVPELAAASVNASFNVKTVIGSASAVTASILADQDNSAATQQSSAASSAAISQSSFDAQNLQLSINSAMNSQSNVDASSASAALSSAIASALSDQNSAAGSVTNSLNQSASNAISSVAASAASSAINSVNNALSNSYQSAVNSQVNSASSSADAAVQSTLGSLSNSANQLYNSLADSYQAALKAKVNTNDQAYQSLVDSANNALASAKASAKSALASLADGDNNTNSATLNSVSASADRDYASLSASYQNQLASQKVSDAASYDQLKLSGDDTLAKLRSNNAQQLASQQASDTASASSAIDSLSHSLQNSASDAVNRVAHAAGDDATKLVSASLASSYAKALADRPGDVNQPLVANSAALDQLASLINSAAVAAQQAAQSTAAAHSQLDSEQSSVNALSGQLGSNSSAMAIKSQFNADQATISSADAIASSNAQLASSAANAADQLKHQSFSDLNSASQATSAATSLFNVADQAKFKAQSANTIAQSAAGDAAQQLNRLQGLVDNNLDAQSNAKIARSDANATSQTAQSVKAIDDQFNAAQTSLHDQNVSLTSQYQKVADQAVSAEVNAHVAASLAANNLSNVQLQAANSQSQSLVSQVYQQIKTAQGNVKVVISLSADADAQGQIINRVNSQIVSANATAQSAAIVASSAAVQNDATTARSARTVADAANQAVQQLNGSLMAAQQQLGRDQDQIKQLVTTTQAQLSTVTQTSDQIKTNLQTIQQLATPNVDSGFSVITNHNDQQQRTKPTDFNPFKIKYYGIENVTDQVKIKALKHRTDLKQINTALSHRYVGSMVQFQLNGQLHRQFDFTKQNVIKNIKAGTKFKVRAVDVKNGVARFLVGHRQWITANVNYIDVLDPNK